MGDTDALRDKIAQAMWGWQSGVHGARIIVTEGQARDLADAVLPVVTQETAQALSLLRSRVEALADELDKEAAHTIDPETARSFPSYVAHLGRRGALRDAARRLRSLLPQDNEEQ